MMKRYISLLSLLKKIEVLWLVLVVLSACTSGKVEQGKDSQTQSVTGDLPESSEMTPLPLSDADTEIQARILEVVCTLSPEAEPSERNVFDEIIPGQSTQADVLELLGDPTEEHVWQDDTIWFYQTYYAGITFRDGVVLKRSDLRTSLGKIVAEFGVPEQVIWRIPKTDYHDASSFTYLLYPSLGAIFAAEEQVTVFETDTFFENTTVATSDYYSFLLSNEVSDEEYDSVIEIEWPCKEQNPEIATHHDEASLTSTPTALAAQAVTPAPSPTPIATNDFALMPFEETLVYVGWDSSSEQTIVGIFDPTTLENIFINPPEDADGLDFGGRPLWGSYKENLMFLGIDQNQMSFWIADKSGDNLQQIGPYYPRFVEDGEKSVGLFLYGWANSGDWVAYAQVLSNVRRELNLLNTQTGEVIETPMKNLYWFQWSPESDLFAYTDSESVYIASLETITIPDTYAWTEAHGLIRWHPSANRILVAASDNRSTKGWNSLWDLNLDTGSPELIGEFTAVTEFDYSPSGSLIALYSFSDPHQINQLTIIDGETKEIIQEIKLPSRFFSDLKWFNEQTVAMNSGDNIYLIPFNQLGSAKWVFDAESLINNILPNIKIVDW